MYGVTRSALARAVFHGKRGELRQRYREGQEDRYASYRRTIACRDRYEGVGRAKRPVVLVGSASPELAMLTIR